MPGVRLREYPLRRRKRYAAYIVKAKSATETREQKTTLNRTTIISDNLNMASFCLYLLEPSLIVITQ